MQITGTSQRGNGKGIRVICEMTPEEASLIGGLAKTAVLHMPICEETASNRSRLRSIQDGMRQIQRTANNPLSPEESFRRACLRYIREKGWKWNKEKGWFEKQGCNVVGLSEASLAQSIYSGIDQRLQNQ